MLNYFIVKDINGKELLYLLKVLCIGVKKEKTLTLKKKVKEEKEEEKERKNSPLEKKVRFNKKVKV
jgi:hypothetical protein